MGWRLEQHGDFAHFLFSATGSWFGSSMMEEERNCFPVLEVEWLGSRRLDLTYDLGLSVVEKLEEC